VFKINPLTYNQRTINSNLATASAAYDLTAEWAKEVGLEPLLDPVNK